MPPKPAVNPQSKLQKVLSNKNKKKKSDVDDSVSSSSSEDDGPDESALFKAVVTPAMVRPGLVLCKNKNNNGNVICKGEPFWKKGNQKPTDTDRTDSSLCLPVCSIVLEKLIAGEIGLAQEEALVPYQKNPYMEFADMKAKDKKYFVRDNILHCTMRTILEMELFDAPAKDPAKLRNWRDLSFFIPKFEQRYEFNENGFRYPITMKKEEWEATGLGVCHKKKKDEEVSAEDEDDDKKDKKKKKKKFIPFIPKPAAPPPRQQASMMLKPGQVPAQSTMQPANARQPSLILPVTTVAQPGARKTANARRTTAATSVMMPATSVMPPADKKKKKFFGKG